jgi:radical SAM protein with 4Fe4S-binding SPASM domain
MYEEKASVRSELMTGGVLQYHYREDCYEEYSGLKPGAGPKRRMGGQSAVGPSIACEDCMARAWSTFCVLPDGKISVCMEFSRREELEFGDALAGALNLEKLIAFQQAYRDSVVNGECAHCWAVRLCYFPGCPKLFAKDGCAPGWQGPETCKSLRTDFAERMKDSIKLYLQSRKEIRYAQDDNDKETQEEDVADPGYGRPRDRKVNERHKG